MSYPIPDKKSKKKASKKIAKKQKITHEGETFIVTPQESASVEKPKKNKPAPGSKENPRKIESYGGEHIIVEIPAEGFSETFFIEVMEDPNSGWNSGKRKPTWELYGYTTYKTAATAKREAARLRKGEIEDYQEQLEREWHRENMHTQQTRQIVQFTVTKKTTKKAIEELAQQIEDHKKRLKETTPVKKPDFSKEAPEYPKYRVRRRVFKVEDEDVK